MEHLSCRCIFCCNSRKSCSRVARFAQIINWKDRTIPFARARQNEGSHDRLAEAIALSHHLLTQARTKYCRYVISRREINYSGHTGIEIPRVSYAASKRDSRKGAFIASESLHYFISPVGIENSSQQAEAALSRFSRRLSRMNLLGTHRSWMLRRQQCQSLFFTLLFLSLSLLLSLPPIFILSVLSSFKYCSGERGLQSPFILYGNPAIASARSVSNRRAYKFHG